MEFAPFILLRRELHRYPEVSQQESATSQRIRDFMSNYPADEVLEEMGGHGLALVYRGATPGETVLLRCELDALPIEEVNTFDYRSSYPGVSHKCGHDGHMSILCSVGAKLSQERPARGRVILLFQPAEENGFGARAVFEDPQFASIRPDWVYALHNLPGYPLGEVQIKSGIFTCASQALVLKLIGKTAHAAQPENGLSPALALAELMQKIPRLPLDLPDRYSLVTLIHVLLGEAAAGIAPGEAQLMATLRTEANEDMEALAQKALDLSQEVTQTHGLKMEYDWLDVFSANVNDSFACEQIRTVARELQIGWAELPHPIRFSEDFGWFSSRFPGAMFGLGSGLDCPSLHNPDYDFPEPLLALGHALFMGLIQKHLA